MAVVLENSAVHPSPPSASTAASRVSTETVERAVNALLKWRNTNSKTQKPQLLEQDDFIYLILSLKKIPPKGRTNAHKIPVPHPLHGDASEFCLIIDDRPKSSKLTSDAVKKKLKAEDIPVSKVLKLSKLKSDFRPFEAKRKLCDSYELFFADKPVVPLLPKLLGKQFFKKKKIPVPVDLSHKNWKEQIERVCSSALLYLRSGTCSVVRIGKVSMESGEIVENVVAAIDGVVEVVPKKWVAVRSFHLKFSDSVALPIYQTLPDMKLKIEGAKKCDERIEEERKKDEKLGKKKGGSKKKGRIHEVRYMDGELGENDDELGNEEEYIGSENIDVGGSELGGKKRKKGDSLNGKVSTKLNGEKRWKKSAKAGERAEEESVEKKVKNGGVGKLKAGGGGASKVKDTQKKKVRKTSQPSDSFGMRSVYGS